MLQRGDPTQGHPERSLLAAGAYQPIEWENLLL